MENVIQNGLAVPIGFEAHFEQHDMYEEWKSDFYAYFDMPENATRYTPAVSFLDERFSTPFSLLDLACGSGTLLRYLPKRCNYFGVDHSEASIQHCRQHYPGRLFWCEDVVDFLNEQRRANVTFDTVVLCGLLFNSIKKNTEEKVNDLKVLQLCVEGILSERGVVVLIVPFAYGSHPEYNFIKQAEWKLDAIYRLLNQIQVEVCFQNISAQIGLEKRVRQQKQLPDWFIADSNQYKNRNCGTYMGAVTLILTF